jgi:hypothetical protein
MTLGQLLDDIREAYLMQFRQSVTELTTAGRRAITEAAFRDEHGSLVGNGALRLPLRGDIFAAADAQQRETVRVDSQALVSFDPITTEWTGGLPTRIAPFHWDACDIRASGVPSPADWSHLSSWFSKWFDREDTREPDEQGFCRVVHFMSDPTHDGSAVTFQVDFGSAPVEAFEELLDSLRDSGATRIEIGHDHAA